jgi:hypothetical protein
MKLYWRLKKKGKWTWRPVKVVDQESASHFDGGDRWILVIDEEE